MMVTRIPGVTHVRYVTHAVRLGQVKRCMRCAPCLAPKCGICRPCSTAGQSSDATVVHCEALRCDWVEYDRYNLGFLHRCGSPLFTPAVGKEEVPELLSLNWLPPFL